MRHASISDVQLTNLTQLLTIQRSLRHDYAEACCRYVLDAPLAEMLIDLSVPQVLAVVANVRDETLFPPRLDLATLLAAPLPLSGALAAVHRSSA
ncbi:flagellar transcriptional regulator FlhD [Luteimonas sp. BDR2-5]|uniref:flagellar transcriptional regulator FlhD n=1 Tax=Proluteimonas luteida TaxID=2878685 RepID=UPI001E382B2F|nr:flagellar transcriptional regulator FlhD [Luteimonas sp. BDR2-5]MCD9026749.1 flagellar transcriptional regulator FlhD [Luteimonas sp. BDR2-5]